MLKFYHLGRKKTEISLKYSFANVQNLRNFLLPILIYYTIVLTDYVLILREIIGIMSIKAGELYDKNSNS